MLQKAKNLLKRSKKLTNKTEPDNLNNRKTKKINKLRN